MKIVNRGIFVCVYQKLNDIIKFTIMNVMKFIVMNVSQWSMVSTGVRLVTET